MASICPICSKRWIMVYTKNPLLIFRIRKPSTKTPHLSSQGTTLIPSVDPGASCKAKVGAYEARSIMMNYEHDPVYRSKCYGKRAYTTKARAKLTIKYMQNRGAKQKSGSQLVAYKCPFCQYYHIGNKEINQ